MELKSDQPDQDKTASAFKVETGQGVDVVMVCAEPGQTRSFGNGKLVSDAQAVALRFTKNGRLAHAFQYGGSETVYEGRSIIKVKSGESFAEMCSNPEGRE